MIILTEMIKKNRKKRVAVAMSGGVDSSVVAVLLVEQGYDVIGITMDLGLTSKDTSENCKFTGAIQDARKVAAQLGIPFYVVDLHQEFTEKVIQYFTHEYLQGRTPNPCIACNRHIKFGTLIQKAKELGADYIATGHYGKIKYDNDKKRYLLYRADDKSKDQSYVLFRLTQKQLSQVLFPLGSFEKTEIRQKAGEIGLNVAGKPESQEICFIPDDNYKNFLQERVPSGQIKSGPFLNTKGEVVGTHQGIAYYTVGQRKGLGLALGYPVYVVSIDPVKNAVILGKDEEVFQQELWAKDNNFIAFGKLKEDLEVEAKIRYNANPYPARIYPGENGYVKVSFADKQRAITPGQAVVYYQGDLVIGGGTIEEVIFPNSI